jgi:hypothetical protein
MTDYRLQSVAISGESRKGRHDMGNGGSHKPVPKDTKASAKKGAESGKKGTKK